MEWARDLALILSSVGAGVFVPKLLAGLWAAVTGGARRQRREIDRVRAELDDEALRRRLAQEHASALRRMLLEAPCVPFDTIPPYPTYNRREHSDE